MRTPQRARYRALLPRCADTAASARRRHQLLGHRNGVPHLHRDWAHRCHICTRTGLTPATSAQGLGPPQPHLHRDWAHPCHICTGTGFRSCNICTATGPPRPHLHRDLAHPGHICTGTGLFPATSAGLGSPLPHLRERAHGTGLLLRLHRLPHTVRRLKAGKARRPAAFPRIATTRTTIARAALTIECGIGDMNMHCGLTTGRCHICAGTGLAPCPHLHRGIATGRELLQNLSVS